MEAGAQPRPRWVSCGSSSNPDTAVAIAEALIALFPEGLAAVEAPALVLAFHFPGLPGGSDGWGAPGRPGIRSPDRLQHLQRAHRWPLPAPQPRALGPRSLLRIDHPAPNTTPLHRRP
jgi:hypothetical protein